LTLRFFYAYKNGFCDHRCDYDSVFHPNLDFLISSPVEWSVCGVGCQSLMKLIFVSFYYAFYSLVLGILMMSSTVNCSFSSSYIFLLMEIEIQNLILSGICSILWEHYQLRYLCHDSYY